jgi:hypothetical protein
MSFETVSPEFGSKASVVGHFFQLLCDKFRLLPDSSRNPNANVHSFAKNRTKEM